MGKSESDIVGRVLPAVIAWGVAKLLEVPPVKGSVRKVDRHVEQHRQRATDAVKQAKDNALDNGIWLAAGVVVVVAGVALLVRATRPK